MTTGQLLRDLLPLNSVRLGRLVRNAFSPHQSFIDPLANRPADDEFDTILQRDFSETRKFSKSSQFDSYLTRTIAFSYRRQSDSTMTLSGPLVTTHDLRNSDAWFSAACGEADTRRWLEKSVNVGSSVYLIVGFRTIQDARVQQSGSVKSTRGVSSEILIVPAPAGVLIPGVGVAQTNASTRDLQYQAEGEQVFAVLYRKVRVKILSRHMSLEANNRWKSCWNWSTLDSHYQEPMPQPVIEADFTDSELDDSEDEELSGDELVNMKEKVRKYRLSDEEARLWRRSHNRVKKLMRERSAGKKGPVGEEG